MDDEDVVYRRLVSPNKNKKTEWVEWKLTINGVSRRCVCVCVWTTHSLEYSLLVFVSINTELRGQLLLLKQLNYVSIITCSSRIVAGGLWSWHDCVCASINLFKSLELAHGIDDQFHRCCEMRNRWTWPSFNNDISHASATWLNIWFGNSWLQWHHDDNDAMSNRARIVTQQQFYVGQPFYADSSCQSYATTFYRLCRLWAASNLIH